MLTKKYIEKNFMKNGEIVSAKVRWSEFTAQQIYNVYNGFDINYHKICKCGNKCSFKSFSGGYTNTCSKECRKKYFINNFYNINEFIDMWHDNSLTLNDIKANSKKPISIDTIRKFAKELNLSKKISKRKLPSNDDIIALPKEMIENLQKIETFYNTKQIMKKYQKENNLKSTYSFEFMCDFYKIKKEDFLTLNERRNLHNSHKPKKEIDLKLFSNMWNNPQISLNDMCNFFGIASCTASIKGKELNLGKKKTNLSFTENEIFKFIEKNCNALSNTKPQFMNNKEIDIFCPDMNFAIEYDGLMFHSEGKYGKGCITNTDKNYHLIKTELCEKEGIQLFHIFENEWNDEIKQKIWKSMILSKLHKTKRIYARKCVIKEISNEEYRNFTENNHIQGYGLAKIKIGLFYENKLVQVMSFSKGRNTISGKYEYEMIRMCSLINTSVIGGASKLFKYFIREYNPKSIVSFANRRWSSTLNNVYEKIGFNLSHISEPNYFYFIGKYHQKSNSESGVLYSRNKFQKHKLENLLYSFDSNKTEWENMKEEGFRRIYDSGNLVYIWSSPEGEENN